MAMQDGATPFFIAAQVGHLVVVQLMCDAGEEKDKAAQCGVQVSSK